MDLNLFIKNFADQFDDTDVTLFTPETKFRDFDEWGSLIGLSIIAMIDDEYDVVVKGDEFRACVTVKDVFDLVASKI